MAAGGRPVVRVVPSDLGERLVQYKVGDTGKRRRSTGLLRLSKFQDLVVVRLEHLELTTASKSYQEYGIYRLRVTIVVCLWQRSSQRLVNPLLHHPLFPLRMHCPHAGPSYPSRPGADVGSAPNDKWIPMHRLPSWRNQNPGTSKNFLNDDLFAPEQRSMYKRRTAVNEIGRVSSV